MIDFPTAKHKFSFFLDRKNQQVTIDINSGAKVYSKHFNAESLGEDTTIRSMALVFIKNHVTLYLDCKKIGVQDLEVNMNTLYSEMDDPVLKLVRRNGRDLPLKCDQPPVPLSVPREKIPSAFRYEHCRRPLPGQLPKVAQPKGLQATLKVLLHGNGGGEPVE